MEFISYKLNRQKKPINIKTYNLKDFEKIGTTGSGVALKYIKGKVIIFAGEYLYDDFYVKPQQDNDMCVKNKAYTYIRINKNEPCHPKNRLRDDKGRPIKEYTKANDFFNQVKDIRFISDDDLDKIFDYAELNNILFDYYNNRWEIFR